MNIQTLLEGSNPYKEQRSQANKLVNKWAKSGLLEGLGTHESEKANMAMMLENQAKQLVKEANETGTGASFSAGNSEAWAGVALPLVRRVFGEIVAKDLVSVQPMNLPSGLIFYLDFQYGNNRPNYTAGDSLYAASADQKKNILPSLADANRGLYGAGRFGYTINQRVDNNVTAISGALSWENNLKFDAEFSASVSAAGESFGAATGDEYFVISVTTGSLANGADIDVEGVRAFTLEGPIVAGLYPQYTRLNGGSIEFVVSGAAGTSLSNLTCSYHIGPDNLNDVGDYEEGKTGVSDGFAANGSVSTMDIPTIDVQLRSDTVSAKTRKLKAQWTPEFAQDLNAYHSIDAEAELTSLLSEYISMEIDLEIIDMLLRNVDTTDHWSVQVAKEVDNAGATLSTAGNGMYYTKMSWFQTIGVKLQSVSNTIHQKTLRGGANFMMVSPKVSTILESIPGFAADSPGDKSKYAMGVQKLGAINNRYTVYKNPYMLENVILMGYKGSQFLETGAVFAPYIPLIMTPLVYDPVSFTPRKGIMTRYAKKMVRPDFYGRIIVHDLHQL